MIQHGQFGHYIDSRGNVFEYLDRMEIGADWRPATAAEVAEAHGRKHDDGAEPEAPEQAPVEQHDDHGDHGE